MSDKKTLQDLMFKNGEELNCDKVIPHNYHLYYASHFTEYIDKPLKLLEIGIGGENREIGGASLKMWNKVFPLAEIYGLDIYEKTELNSEMIKTFIVDQGDANALNIFSEENGPFDIIIDDGSHRRSDQLTSLFNLIPHVKPGGYYILEDYFTSYWPVYDGSTLAKDFLDTPVRWMKQSIDIINRNNMLSDETKSRLPNWNIEELHVYPGIAFLKKGLTENKSEIPNEEFNKNQIELDALRYGEYKNIFSLHAINPMTNLDILKQMKTEIDLKITSLEKNK